MHGNIVRTTVKSTNDARVQQRSLWCLHFPQRAKSLTQTAFFSLTPTNTPSYTASTDDSPVFVFRGHLLLLLMRSGLKKEGGLKYSSDWHLWCHIPLWSRGGGVILINTQTLEGKHTLHTLPSGGWCHLKAQHHTWKTCLLSDYWKALILLLCFYDLFLVTEFFLWTTVSVVLLYFCRCCSVRKGTHIMFIFRLGLRSADHHSDKLHLIFSSSSESCCVFPVPNVHWCWTMCRHIEFL